MPEELPLPLVKVVTAGVNYQQYEIGPLLAGYATVLGNTLRRVLLSSIPGAAVTSIRIEGVPHEFTDIPDVMEDVPEIVLAVKQLRLRSFSDVPVTMRLDACGEGEVTAACIVTPDTVEIVNPSLHLATLSDQQARLVMELVVERGVGFSLASTAAEQPIGIIGVDALFSPIQKVNFRVDPVRFAQNGTLDLLTLEIWTDGALPPDEAFRQAAKIVTRLLIPFTLLQGTPGTDDVLLSESLSTGIPIPPEIYQLPIEHLDLSVRSINCLKRAKINVVGQVLELGEEDLLAIKNFGRKSLQELVVRVQACQLLSGDVLSAPPH